MAKRTAPTQAPTPGRLRIGDQWNAITIIALSQNNPLKAVAEFVENSIDAKARHITITRGREKGHHYLRIKDDGEGIRRNAEGVPDFQYVATHICDSMKRQMKRQGSEGLQGEFGIGLLSFWTVGEELTLSATSADGTTHRMHLRKNDPGYRVTHRRLLVPDKGTELTIRPVLPGLRQLNGEKIQWYLASELRDRIRQSGVKIKVVDRTSRTEHRVEPREFEGRFLHEIRRLSSHSDELSLELYLNRPDPSHRVGLHRAGTRVLECIAELSLFQHAPWNKGYLQGIIDFSRLNLTPGTRTGIIHDGSLARLAEQLEPVEEALNTLIEEQQRAEEERTSRDVLKSIQRALREALLALPTEEYDWFELQRRNGKPARTTQDPDTSEQDASPGSQPEGTPDEALASVELEEDDAEPQKQFFQYAGPLFSVRISPASSVIPVGTPRPLRAVARDRRRQPVEENVSFAWSIAEGAGELEHSGGEMATFKAGTEPGLVRLKVLARQDAVTCDAEALVTVVQSLVPSGSARDKPAQGIPSYTFQKAPGELWRSKFDGERNVIVINNGHRDFVYASRNKALKLRYVCRLFSKELVLKNFRGLPANDLLERLIELSLYTEENLKG